MVVLEYIWLDHKSNFRSKTKVTNKQINDLKDIPMWNYDGSSTEQAPGSDSEVYIKPVAVYKDPFRKDIKNSFVVLCDTWLPSGDPHPDNTRVHAEEIFNNQTVLNEEPLFGIEQEFFFKDTFTNKPLGFPKEGFPNPQGQYYCGVGAQNCYGRQIAESILEKSLYCNLEVTGLNFEVAPGQCEFQLCDYGIKASDDLLFLRYIMVRTAEHYNVKIDLHPKPIKGDWNGSGCHTNYSTNSMREDGGLTIILDAIEKLKNKHNEHIHVYGVDNDQRLTGAHETASINDFSYGVADRGSSIRIPRFTDRDGKGYMEDRRPASNMDPYIVTSKIVETTLL